MLLKIDNSRTLELPDDMPDETARQLKRWILTLEERATSAESSNRTLQDEMTALRKSHEQTQAAVNTATLDNTATVNAIRDMHREMVGHLRHVAAAASADRMVVPDPITGEMTRSRLVM